MTTFLDIDSSTGRRKQKRAVQTSAGAGDATKLVALNSAGKIDNTMMPDGVGADAVNRTASEAISARAIVNIASDGTVRNADASTEGFEAMAFAPGAISNGASGEIRFDGTITGLSGLTPGAFYFLSETAGGITLTAVSGANKVSQIVGQAISTTELTFQPGEPVTLA